MTDQDYLKRAIEVGNRKEPPYNFGAVVIVGGQIVAESESKVHETLDPSAHSEVLALRMACQSLGVYPLQDATLYSSHEPCVMCFSCAVWTGISRVVYVTSASEQDKAMYEFADLSLDELANKSARQRIVVRRQGIEEV